MTGGYYTTTYSNTFTVTHAEHIAAKVWTDLKRMQRFYGKPDEREINDYEREIVALLYGDYLDLVTYGFHKNSQWIIALKYAARYGGILIQDDRPGGIPRNIDISGCYFTSFLYYNQRWTYLSLGQQRGIYRNAGVSFWREEGKEPQGNWRSDKTYSAGGRGVLRHTIG